jgi:hypothetical protein
VFRNFAEANGIDCIFMPAHVQLTIPYANSVEFRSLFKQAVVPYITDTTIVTKKSSSYVLTEDLVLAEN